MLEPEEPLVSVQKTFYVHPEHRMPAYATPEGAREAGLTPATRIWQWTGDESLHSFWAIQRLSAEELKRNNLSKGSAKRFNVELTTKQYNLVTVGELKGTSVSVTASVSVPMITNPKAIAEGDDLLLEVAAKAAVATKRKTTSWKDDLGTSAKDQAKSQKLAAKAKAKQIAGVDIVSEV